MKKPLCLLGVASGGLIMLLAGCADPLKERINQNPQLYSTLSQNKKDMIAKGKVERGMSKSEVLLAWGEPDQKIPLTSYNGARERWIYHGYVPVYGGRHVTFDEGPGARGSTMMTPLLNGEATGNFVPYDVRRGDFVDDRLSAWQVVR